MTVDTYLHQGRQLFARFTGDDRVRGITRVAGVGATGFFLSAAGLSHWAQPLSMALVSAMTGWRAVVMGLGSAAGYLVFWGEAGIQGAVWAVLAMVTALVLGQGHMVREVPLILPAFSALWTAAAGLGFRLAGYHTPVRIYLLRVALAWAATQLFAALIKKRESLLLWCAEGTAVLALAQISPVPWLNLGCVAAGALAAGEALPGAVLAGLALDLAQITPVPMTAVMAAVCIVRMTPGIPQFVLRLAPGAVFLLMAPISGGRSLTLLPGLLLGGILSVILPGRAEPGRRWGETGVAQLRLEGMARVLRKTRGLLLETEDTPIDEDALLARTRERSCGNCPNRRSCQIPAAIPRELLQRPLTENTSLPFFCRKPGRMVLEIRRSQDQYRLMKAERERRRECRAAVSQQYLFLSEYLLEQSEQLPRRSRKYYIRFSPEVGFSARSRETENGDRFRHFPGPGGIYFLLLCDGMGTGLGAAEEGKTASSLLQEMLTAGFPPEHALESLNSLLALRGRAGAVTVDLAQVHLDTGAAVLYKWGAAPSLILRGETAEKIGTAGPPPGIRGADVRFGQERLSLRRGECLIILSDGVDGEEVCRRAVTGKAGPAGELAARLLEAGTADVSDDATVAVIRLHRSGMLT